MLKIFLFLLSVLFSISNIFSWSYPLKLVSKPTSKCKFSYWHTLGNNCKILLPKLIPSSYNKHKNDVTFYRRIYTILWASSYKYGWDIGNGTHLGVDFATSLGTPVYAIGHGKVVFAGNKGARGKVVIIQHKINGKYIYSNYAHLSKIYVNFNQIVNSNKKIGEVGHTGNSYGNHLHFQIDINQSIGAHPFWFKYCSKGKSINQIVNNTFCLPEVEKYTIDPLKFLSSNGAIIKNVNKKNKIERRNLVSYEKIQEKIVREFIKNYKFSFNFSNAGVYHIGKYGKFSIFLKDIRGRNYNNLLPEDLNIIYDKSFFYSFSPRGLKIINGSREVSFLPKKSGITYIQFKLGKKIIYQKAIRIIKKGQYVIPKYGKIITLGKYNYIGTPIWGINIFQDKKFINIIKVPFANTYYLTSSTHDIIFCKSPINIKYLNYFQCNAYNMSKILKFSYKDTIFGLFIFKFISNTGKNTHILVKDLYGKIISKSKILKFKEIKLTNKKNIYQKDVRNICKKGICLNLIDRGYIWVDKKINFLQFKYLIENISSYLGNKKKIKKYKIDSKKTITRIKFLKLVLSALKIKIKDYKNNNSRYMDIKKLTNREKNYIIYITKLGFMWKDKFRKLYFQPNKEINMGEGLYLINFLIGKYK